MSELFALEWMGGVAEHHFHRARPGAEQIPWHELDKSRYSDEALLAARSVWTDVALSEYAAIASFSQVVTALAECRAPLDLIGMTGDFLADEVRHVELASRLAMQLGGAVPRAFDPSRLTPRSEPNLTPLQRANELALRIGCIGEPFASGTALPMMQATTQPVVRAVYESILRDEARHCRFGSLYFEWAEDKLDSQERERLAQVALRTLRQYASLWRRPASLEVRPPSKVTEAEARELGWLPFALYVPLAIATVRDEILPALRALELPLAEDELSALLV